MAFEHGSNNGLRGALGALCRNEIGMLRAAGVCSSALGIINSLLARPFWLGS